MRAIMPQLSQAQLVIISLRFSRSLITLGMINDCPTGSPDAGEGKVIASLVCGLCCWSYRAARDLTPFWKDGWVVTSPACLPPIHTSAGFFDKRSIYCCPVRAGMLQAPKAIWARLAVALYGVKIRNPYIDCHVDLWSYWDRMVCYVTGSFIFLI